MPVVRHVVGTLIFCGVACASLEAQTMGNTWPVAARQDKRASEPDAAVDAAGRGLVLYTAVEAATHRSSIELRRVDPRGRLREALTISAASPATQVAGGISMDPSSGRFVAVWSVAGATPSIRARVLDVHGQPITGEVVVAQEEGSVPSGADVVIAPRGGFFVTWTSTSAGAATVRARAFEADGDPRGDAFDVTGPFSSAQASSCRTGSGRAVVVTSTANSGEAPQLVVRFFSPDGDAIGGAVAVDTSSTSFGTVPFCDLGEGFALTATSPDGQQGFVAAFDDAGQPSGAPIEIAPADGGLRKHVAAAFASNGWLATWTTRTRVMGRWFTLTGDPQGEPFPLATLSGAAERVATASSGPGHVAVAWSTSGVAARACVRRLEASASGVAEVSVHHTRVTEGDVRNPGARFWIRTHQPRAIDLTIEYETRPGSATAGVDYEPTTGSVVLPAGTMRVAVEVPVRSDSEEEDSEFFWLALTDAPDASIAMGEAAALILDDDRPRDEQ